MGQPRSEQFKQAAVQKYHNRGTRKVDAVAEELGVSSWSLYQWSKRYGTSPGMKKPDRRPQDWSALEKLKAVVEYEGLAAEKRVEFLRREGLHSDHIEAWKKSILELDSRSVMFLNQGLHGSTKYHLSFRYLLTVQTVTPAKVFDLEGSLPRVLSGDEYVRKSLPAHCPKKHLKSAAIPSNSVTGLQIKPETTASQVKGEEAPKRSTPAL